MFPPDDRSLSKSPSAWLATVRDLAELMAHDLRNPLAALIANVNYVGSSLPAADLDARSALADMRSSLQLALRLADNQVTIARLEARPSEPASKRTFALGRCVVPALERVQSSLTDADVTLTVDDRSDGALVSGDRAQCELLIENLLGNSAQHAGRGHTARLELTASETEVCVVLEDDGPPFGPASRDFTREGQIGMKTRPAARYSRGLALYVVGLVVGDMSGSIDTTPAEGRGRVTLRVPRV